MHAHASQLSRIKLIDNKIYADCSSQQPHPASKNQTDIQGFGNFSASGDVTISVRRVTKMAATVAATVPSVSARL